MKTPMAPNYATNTLIQRQFRTEFLRDYFLKTGLSPLVCFVLLAICYPYGPLFHIFHTELQ